MVTSTIAPAAGFCLRYKRLAKTKFQWPRQHTDGLIR